MCSDHLGVITDTQNRIDMDSGAKRIHEKLYEARGDAPDVEIQEVGRILEIDVIEHVYRMYAKPVVLVQKKADTTMPCCINCRNLNAVLRRKVWNLEVNLDARRLLRMKHGGLLNAIRRS